MSMIDWGPGWKKSKMVTRKVARIVIVLFEEVYMVHTKPLYSKLLGIA